MKIKSADFIISNTEYKKCPIGKIPEYAFIGRSNVGKSSLINTEPITNNSDTYEELIKLKTFNREKDKSDWHAGFGLNFKITDLQSALGLSQLSRLDSLIKKKKELFQQSFLESMIMMMIIYWILLRNFWKKKTHQIIE